MVEGGQDPAVVTLEDVTVDYGSVRALDGLSLVMREGATGLLGPNGAGKTTLLRVLLGHLRPRRAKVRVAGEDPGSRRGRLALRRRVGYMPEGVCLLPGMNGIETLVTLARITGLAADDAMSRAHEVLDWVELGEARYRRVAAWSTGMQQRLKLAQALLHDPPLLLLDEPTSGLDPKGRSGMLELVADLAGKHGKSLLLCSHLLLDVERTCRDVIVLDQGRVRTRGAIEELTRSDGCWLRVALRGGTPDGASAFARALEARGLGHVPEQDGTHRVRLADGTVDADPVFAAAREAGVAVTALEPTSRSLEEVFLDVLGRERSP